MKYAQTDIEDTAAEIGPLVVSILRTGTVEKNPAPLIRVLEVGVGLLNDRHEARMRALRERLAVSEYAARNRPRPQPPRRDSRRTAPGTGPQPLFRESP